MEEQKEDVPTLLYLPQEIIEQIVVRLPVKSRLRFKCVSKPWRSIISGDSFITAHLLRSTNDRSLEHHRIIFDDFTVQASECFSPTFLREPLPGAGDSKHPMCCSSHVVGSCYGLVCVLNKGEDFILWNPSTGKSKKLPPFVDVDGTEQNKPMAMAVYGFGYDELNSDYKVFVKLTERSKGWVFVYSLKTNSWRKVDCHSTVDSFLGIDGRGLFVSGKLHWDVRPTKAGIEIVSFDLENEIFGTAVWPSLNADEEDFILYEIDGCICYVSITKPNHTDYWILKEHGGGENSWYKIATAEWPSHFRSKSDDDDDDSDDDDDFYAFVPTFVGANGDILCWDGRSYAVLPKDGSHFLSPKKLGLRTRQHPVRYVESLVEP